MSKVSTQIKESLEPVVNNVSINSEFHFSEISYGLYNKISDAFSNAQKTDEGTVPGFCICCVQGCCVSHCCVQCMKMN